MTSAARRRFRTLGVGFAWWFCFIILLPFLIILDLVTRLVDLIIDKRTMYKRRAEERKWAHYPQYPNGTLITGRLTESELEAEADTQIRACSPSSNIQGNALPFLPPETIREIIRHATDTFPAPFTIHCPTSPLRSTPSSYPPFPYSNNCLQGDTAIDRKLHAISMNVKLSVSRVSRTWRDATVEFLFNSIRICNPRQVRLLWRAFEGDARRRGEEPSMNTVAQPGSAPWWIRELWIDLGSPQGRRSEPGETLPLFGLSDLLKLCPQIVVYRGSERWSVRSQFPIMKHGVVFRRLLGIPDEWGDETQGEPEDSVSYSNLDIPDTGRRIGLHLTNDSDPFFPFLRAPPLSFSAPITLNLPRIEIMELRNFNYFAINHPINLLTFRLPNLTHLSMWGSDTLVYATARLALPSLRAVSYGKGGTGRSPPRLVTFLEKHGLALEELTVLDKVNASHLQKSDQICPVLQILRTYWRDLPTSTVASVTTVGLYGLEHVGADFRYGEKLVHNIFERFPNVTTIQDMSWRSGVIRRRAYTNWRDPEGANYRMFWTDFLHAVQTGLEHLNSDQRFTVREVTFLDWRGRAVDPVPTSPPGDHDAVLGPDDQLLDDLVSGARL